jgi:hypothetical protein
MFFDPSQNRTGIEPKMRAAVGRAMELDPLLPEAHEALGIARAHDRQWGDSEKSFRRGIELDRSRSASYASFGFHFYAVLGRIDDGLRQLRFALKADPLSADVHDMLAYCSSTQAGTMKRKIIAAARSPSIRRTLARSSIGRAHASSRARPMRRSVCSRVSR